MAKNMDFHIANFLSIWNCIFWSMICISISKYGIPYHKNTKRNYCPSFYESKILCFILLSYLYIFYALHNVASFMFGFLFKQGFREPTNLKRKRLEIYNCFKVFLAALSSSRSIVVGPSVGRSVYVCEKVIFRISNESEWVIEWLSDWVTEWLSDWVTEWLSDWVNGWLRDCVTEWLNDWNFVTEIF